MSGTANLRPSQQSSHLYPFVRFTLYIPGPDHSRTHRTRLQTHIHTTMAIRARAKAFFRRSRNNDDTLSKTDSTDSHERWPSNVYKPGEPMPRPKYRAPPKKEHKEHLDSFSFADAWRRKSFQSQYSPMGTRAPSRLPSAAPSRRSSWYSRKKSMSYGRSGSVTSVDSQKSAGDAMKRELSQKSRREIERKPSQRSGHIMSREPSQSRSDRRVPNHTQHAAIATRLSTEIEQEGDDDVFNGELYPSFVSPVNKPLTPIQSACHAYIHTSATRFLALAQWQRTHTAAISERLPIIAWSATTTQFRPTTTILSPNRNWLLRSSALTSQSLSTHDVLNTCWKGMIHCAYNNLFDIGASFLSSWEQRTVHMGFGHLWVFLFAYGVERTARVDETSWSNTRKGVEFEGNLLGRVEYSSESGGVLFLSHLGLIRSV